MQAKLQYAGHIKMHQYAGHIATCRRPTSGSAWDHQQVVSLSYSFQRALLAALRGTDGGSCRFHCMILAAFCDSGVCLCLFLLLNVVYLPIYARVDRRYDKTNVKWYGGRHSELLTLENHADLTSFGRHDFP